MSSIIKNTVLGIVLLFAYSISALADVKIIINPPAYKYNSYGYKHYSPSYYSNKYKYNKYNKYKQNKYNYNNHHYKKKNLISTITRLIRTEVSNIIIHMVIKSIITQAKYYVLVIVEFIITILTRTTTTSISIKEKKPIGKVTKTQYIKTGKTDWADRYQ